MASDLANQMDQPIVSNLNTDRDLDEEKDRVIDATVN